MDPTAVLAGARSALQAVNCRTVELLRSLSALDVPIPGSDWTVREAAIHLVNYAGVYTGLAQGEPSPLLSPARDYVARENLRRIADIPEDDPLKVSELVSRGVEELLEATADGRGERPILYAGIHLDLAGLVGMGLAEQILHGYDMACAVGFPWPIDPAHVGLVLYGYAPCFGEIVNPETAGGHNVAYGVELRGGASFTGRFTDGAFSTEAPGGPVDCVISVDPVAFLLWGSGRITPWKAIALGLLAPGGDRPELAPGFADLFVFP